MTASSQTPTPEQLRAALAELGIQITTSDPKAAPVDKDVSAGGTEAAKRAEAGHKAYHTAAELGGLLVYELRCRGYSWRQIDKMTNIAPRTADRWMKLHTEGGNYVEGSRDE